MRYGADYRRRDLRGIYNRDLRRSGRGEAYSTSQGTPMGDPYRRGFAGYRTMHGYEHGRDFGPAERDLHQGPGYCCDQRIRGWPREAQHPFGRGEDWQAVARWQR